MATATPPLAPVLLDGSRFLLSNIRWETYEALVNDLAERHVRLTYDDGDLELISPQKKHERSGRLIGRMIDILTEELDMPLQGGKSTTFKQRVLKKGLEPDECYWVQNEERVRGKLDFDEANDPPPDLAIEIDITSSSLNRQGIYAALGVPELWRFDGESLDCLHLQADGTYAQRDQSLSFPFLPLNEVVRFVHLAETMSETSWARSFRAWVRDEIAPHDPGPAGEAG